LSVHLLQNTNYLNYVFIIIGIYLEHTIYTHSKLMQNISQKLHVLGIYSRFERQAYNKHFSAIQLSSNNQLKISIEHSLKPQNNLLKPIKL